ncbi:MAG: NDP-sugar synthase [Actinomycetota bacterium]|nr:NDP-sugar synthase [Actinomycetota bacterium]
MTATGVLLAAGRGERLRPLTDIVPKPALPLLDLPLGAWGLANLLAATDEVIVNVSHLGERVVGALAGFGDFGVLDEGAEPWGSAGTLAAVNERARDTLLVRNADVLTEVDAADLLAAHRAHGATGTIAVRSVESGADLTVEGRLASGFIHRKEEPAAAGAQYLGTAAFERRALALLTEQRPAGLAEFLLRPLIERGELAVHLSSGYALDVGTIERYLAASADLLAGRGPLPPRPIPGELIEITRGRAYLGPEVTADEESLGPGAVILAGAALHEGSYVTNAIVWQDEQVPAGVRVENGVWAEGRLHR